MPIYGLRFRALGQTLYHTGPADLAVGDHVLIAADQGQALAQVVSGPYDYVAGVEPESLTPFRAAGVDTLVLGCTHYPLLAELIGDFMGPEVKLIDVGRTCADAVAGRLADMDALSAAGRTGESRYYVSDSAEDFSRLASVFLRRDVEEAVTQVEIWNY